MPIRMLTGVGGVRTPARITAIYTAFGLLWIWLSDWLLQWLGYTGDSGFLTAVIKGTAFVLLTAMPLFWLVRREVAAIRQSAILLRAVIEGTTDAVYVKDCDGRHLLVNEAAAGFLGRSVAEAVGRNNHELFEFADAERLFASDQAIMAGGEVVTTEETLTAAGVSRTYHATKAPLRDANGKLIGLIGISRDISDRKQAELALFESEKRFRQLADAIPQNCLDGWAGWRVDALECENGGVHRVRYRRSARLVVGPGHPPRRPAGRGRLLEGSDRHGYLSRH